jgi:hypothetical protein
MMSELYAEAGKLAGRPVEVEKLKDGKFVVLWMRFEASPPEPGDTEEDALKNFIAKMQKLAPTVLPEEEAPVSI